eukprot:6183071-Karenia_brevis.AAC.1
MCIRDSHHGSTPLMLTDFEGIEKTARHYPQSKFCAGQKLVQKFKASNLFVGSALTLGQSKRTSECIHSRSTVPPSRVLV